MGLRIFPYSHLVAICSSGTSIPMLNIANQPVFLDITQVYLNTTDMDESQNCLGPWHPARFSSRNTVSNSEGLSTGYHRITYIVSVNISKWLSAMGGCMYCSTRLFWMPGMVEQIFLVDNHLPSATSRHVAHCCTFDVWCLDLPCFTLYTFYTVLSLFWGGWILGTAVFL